MTNSILPYEPRPSEIRRECARIRSGWSEAEHHKRAGEPLGDAWCVPVTSIHIARQDDDEPTES